MTTLSTGDHGRRGADRPAVEANPPRRLVDCTTDGERLGWMRRRLQAGEVLTEPGMRFGGIRPPIHFIERLRASGMVIEGCLVTTTDRKGAQHHNTRAWRMARSEP